MVQLVQGETALDAWRAGAASILAANGGQVFHLVSTIERPHLCEPSWLTRYDVRRVLPAKDSTRSVIEVIAPRVLLRGEPRADRYLAAWRLYDQLRARGVRISQWREAYFERLTRVSVDCNPLERLIGAMNGWQAVPANGFYIAISPPERDPVRKLGSPCLQYLQFHPVGNRVDLTAVYRNHDFLIKAFGNLLGLGRLLSFVAQETGRQSGRLTCLSVHAYTTQKSKLRELIGI